MARLTLLQINDTHGYLEPHPEIIWTAQGPSVVTMGGFARVATIFAEARSDGETLAFDNGDTFHGTPALVSSRGEAIVPILNALGISAMTGHWDFAYGPKRLKELVDKLDFPFLAANCDSAAPRFQSSIICGQDVKVGVIGLAATILDKTMPESFSEGLRFSDGLEETRREAARLRDAECDLIVVLSHLGFPQDCALAEAVDGIDVILSGHTHNRMTDAVTRNGALIFQSGCHGSFVGRLDVAIERLGQKALAGCSCCRAIRPGRSTTARVDHARSRISTRARCWKTPSPPLRSGAWKSTTARSTRDQDIQARRLSSILWRARPPDPRETLQTSK